MIQIKPLIRHATTCPYCATLLEPARVLWQGIHVAVIAECSTCGKEVISDLPIGQAVFTPFQVNRATGEVFGNPNVKEWFGKPFVQSLQHPEADNIGEIRVTRRKEANSVVILNCLDYLYGHSLLKLLNADIHKSDALIVIVQPCLKWMVPDYVAEIWEVNLPFARSRSYFPMLDASIQHEMERFDSVYVSPAFSHPANFEIRNFTAVPIVQLDDNCRQITFVWREDRLWASKLTTKILKPFGLALSWQNFKIRRLFKKIQLKISDARFVVVGLGQSTRFPDWVSDMRVQTFDAQTERRTCEIYAASHLIVGVHGSNMLLPSAHGWATIDLMPDDRWPNLAQDILYQPVEQDSRIASWRYHFISLHASMSQLAKLAITILQNKKTILEQFSDRSGSA